MSSRPILIATRQSFARCESNRIIWQRFRGDKSEWHFHSACSSELKQTYLLFARGYIRSSVCHNKFQLQMVSEIVFLLWSFLTLRYTACASDKCETSAPSVLRACSRESYFTPLTFTALSLSVSLLQLKVRRKSYINVTLYTVAGASQRTAVHLWDNEVIKWKKSSVWMVTRFRSNDVPWLRTLACKVQRIVTALVTCLKSTKQIYSTPREWRINFTTTRDITIACLFVTPTLTERLPDSVHFKLQNGKTVDRAASKDGKLNLTQRLVSAAT